jgi:WhiB family redox-sensing transcriptional regulator
MRRSIIRLTNEYLDYQTFVNSLYPLWKHKANCSSLAHSDVDFFDVKDTNLKVLAKKYCNTCPAKSECLYTALVNQEAYGLWGGLTTKQRKSLTAYIAQEAVKSNIDHSIWSPQLEQIYKHYSGIQEETDIFIQEEQSAI